jgi:D-amino peptidase
MKIYILADMEGISGIRMREHTNRECTQYADGCKLMMADIDVAVEAAFSAGATEIVVCDTHGNGGQIRIDMMDPRATYEMPRPGRNARLWRELPCGKVLR